MRYLVTAGGTRESIDKVRRWGNVFTGQTGFDIAAALAQHGEVDLLTSNADHVRLCQRGLALAHAVRAQPFESHSDLRALLTRLMAGAPYDAVVMTAAIADYQPAGAFAVLERKPGSNPGEEIWTVRNVQAGKVKSNHRALAIYAEPTQKLVDLFRTQWQHKGLLIKFKLEVGIADDELIRIGSASRLASGADYLVANTLEMTTGSRRGAYLLSEGKPEWIERDTLAQRLATLVQRAAGK